MASTCAISKSNLETCDINAIQNWLESIHNIKCISMNQWSKQQMLEVMYNTLLLSNCNAQICRQHNEILLFLIRVCVIILIGFTIYLLVGLLRDVLEILKSICSVFYEAMVAMWHAIYDVFKILCRMVFEVSMVSVTAIKEIWPHCTRDNIILISSIFLLLITFPEMAASAGKFMDKLITAWAMRKFK